MLHFRVDPKNRQKCVKTVFVDFFDVRGRFLTLRAGRPGETLLRLFGDFRARGSGDFCKMGIAIVELL